MIDVNMNKPDANSRKQPNEPKKLNEHNKPEILEPQTPD